MRSGPRVIHRFINKPKEPVWPPDKTHLRNSIFSRVDLFAAASVTPLMLQYIKLIASTRAPLLDACPFLPCLSCVASKSKLAQNVTVNNRQSTHQSSYVSFRAGAQKKKSILCFSFLLTGTTCALQKTVLDYDKCTEGGGKGDVGKM